MHKRDYGDVMDYLEAVEPDNKQLVVEVDHSAGHAKSRGDPGCAWRTSTAKYRGKHKVLRDNIYHGGGVLGSGGGQYALEQQEREYGLRARVTTETVKLKPKVGEKQSVIISPGAPPPSYACDAPAEGMMERKARGKRKRS